MLLLMVTMKLLMITMMTMATMSMMMMMKSRAEVKSHARSDVCRFSLELKQDRSSTEFFLRMKSRKLDIDRLFLFLSDSQYLSSLQELNFSCPKQVRFFTSLVANLVYNKNSNLCTLPSCQISKLFINIGSQYLDIVERVH